MRKGKRRKIKSYQTKEWYNLNVAGALCEETIRAIKCPICRKRINEAFNYYFDPDCYKKKC
jgi:hypothetical protein